MTTTDTEALALEGHPGAACNRPQSVQNKFRTEATLFFCDSQWEMRAKKIMVAADMRRIFVPFVFLAVVLAGCAATMGTGIGSTPSGSNRATFTWYANGASTGQMTATLADGQTFSGPYFQITRTTDVTTLGPLWAGWGRRFGGWGDWGPSSEFVTQYTGRVVGNLESPNGTHMRCHFDLARPDLGMAGGGLGQCELPNGTTIDAMFATA